MTNCSTGFVLNPHEVSLWRASLEVTAATEMDLRQLLSVDEIDRAERFRFAIHKRRFIVARGILRSILSYYLCIPPQSIVFTYNDRGKPSVLNTQLQFNLSHSHEIAVYAITAQHPVGIDIEKIGDSYEDNVAKRFFSHDEYASLIALSPSERVKAFYCIWSRKEAVIKALGEGLAYPLSAFSVSSSHVQEQIKLHSEDACDWHLESFFAGAEYQSAFATKQRVDTIRYWQWTMAGPSVWDSLV